MRREITARHRCITGTCRENKGDAGVVKEVTDDIRDGLKDLLASWPVESGVVVHVRVSVEYGHHE